MSKKKELKQGGLAWLIAKWALLVVQAVVSVMLIISLITMGVLKVGIIIAVAVGLLALFVVNLIFLILRKKTGVVVSIVCAVIAVLVTTAGIVDIAYWY